jgi:hypothetical protein
MAPFSSNVWSPGESSLKRSSFNALVAQRQTDVPEMIEREKTMGRQAEFGPGWTPPGIAARRLVDGAMQAATMATPSWQSHSLRTSPVNISLSSMARRQCSAPIGPSSPNRDFFRSPVAATPPGGTLRDFLRRENPSGVDPSGESSQRDLQKPAAGISRFNPVLMGAPKTAWGSMLVQRADRLRQSAAASAPGTPRSSRPGCASTLQSTMRSPGSLPRPGTAPDAAAPNGLGMSRTRSDRCTTAPSPYCTTAWRPNELSLARSSLNHIVSGSGSKFDVPEAMMRQTSMGRQAEFGPDWVPPGVLARQMSNLLTSS